MSRAVAIVCLAVVVTGCGGSSKASADLAQGRLGHAVGAALVCMFSQAKYPSTWALAQDFRLWVSGRLTAKDTSFGYARPCPAPPAHPLSATARFAAARVVLRWAATVPVRRWGPGAVAYLKANGVNTTPVHVPPAGP